MFSKRARIFAVALVALVVASGVHSSARPRYRVRTRQVATGLVLKRILDRRGPNQIRVLEMDPASRLTLDVALGSGELPGHETVRSMARRYGAIAATNGDFTLRPTDVGAGRPVNTFIEDGELHASPLIWGRNFSITADETTAQIGHSGLTNYLVQSTGERWRIQSVNPVRHSPEGFTLYTPAGGQLFRPPPDSCGVRLSPASDYRWRSRLNGVGRDFTVGDVICREQRIARAGDYVMTTPRTSFDAFTLQTSLTAGETVSFEWSMRRPGVLDTIGGNPDIVQDGRIVNADCTGSYYCRRHPRTGVGVKPDGTILLVTVDGRRRSSVGLTLGGFGRLFQYLGAESALNLDGGGATTMLVRDRVVNVPSDGHERAVGTALLVLPSLDHQEPRLDDSAASGSAEPEPTPTPTPSPTSLVPAMVPADGIQGQVDTSCRALLDPASTGGMLDAYAKGLLGPHSDLPNELISALRAFRGATFC